MKTVTLPIEEYNALIEIRDNYDKDKKSIVVSEGYGYEKRIEFVNNTAYFNEISKLQDDIANALSNELIARRTVKIIQTMSLKSLRKWRKDMARNVNHFLALNDDYLKVAYEQAKANS